MRREWSLRSVLATGMWVLLGAAILLGGTGNQPPTRQLDTQPVLNVVDLLTTPIYKIRTTLARPDGTVVERTANGVILLPTTVDVDPPGPLGLGSPDLLVTILPRLPLGVGVNISRMPLLGQSKPIRIELELTLPTQGNKVVTFGYDARTSRSPKVFDANIQFGLQPGSTDLGLTTRITEPGSTLDLHGSIFSRPSGAPANVRVDPTSFLLGATPVPAKLDTVTTFTPGLAAFGDANDKNVDVTVHSSSPFHAHAVAKTVRGDDTMDLDVDVPQLPADLGLTYHNVKSTDLTEVTIKPAGGIPSASANYTKVTDAVTTQKIVATATGIPSRAKLTIDGDKLAAGAELGYGEAAEREGITWDANGPLSKLKLTYDRTDETAKPVHFEGDIDALPPFVTAQFDKVGAAKDLVVNANTRDNQPIGKILAGVTLGDNKTVPYLTTDAPTYSSTDTSGSLRAAALLKGVKLVKIDTRNPLVVETHAVAANRFVAKHVSPTLNLDADVLDLPKDVTLTLTTPPAAGAVPVVTPRVTIVDVKGSDPIKHVDATVHLTPIAGPVTHAVAHIDELPKNFTATLTDGPGGRHDVVWAASGATKQLDADVTTADALGVPVHLTALVKDLPSDLTVVFEKRGRDTFAEATAGKDQLIGLVEAGFATGKAEIPTRTEPAHAAITTTEAGTGAHVRVTDLQHVLVDTSEPFVLDVDLKNPLTFVIAEHTPERTIDATVIEVPAETHIEVATKTDDKLTSTIVTAKNSAAIKAIDGTFTINEPRTITGTLDLDQVPDAFTLTIDDSNVAEFNSIGWSASSVTEHIGVVADLLNATGDKLHVDAIVDRLPKDVLVTIEKLGRAPDAGRPDTRGSRVVVEALNDATIGAIRVGLGKNGVAIPFLEVPDYVSASNDGNGGTGVAARITNVRKITADTGDPFDVTVNLKDALPFVVKQATNALTIDATVHDLPAVAHVKLDVPDPADAIKKTLIHYDGEGTIGLVDGTFKVTGATGATFDGTFDLSDLPRVVDVTLTDDDAADKLTADYTGSSEFGPVHVNGKSTPVTGAPTTIDVVLPRVPGHAVVTIDGDTPTADSERHTVTWNADAPITRLDALVDTETKAGLPLHLVAGIDDIPEDLTVIFDTTPAGLVAEAKAGDNQQVRALDVGLKIGTATIPTVTATDGANLTKQGDDLGVKAIVHGVEKIRFDSRDPMVIEAHLDQAKPFKFDATIDGVIVDATVTNLPANSLIRIDQANAGDDPKTTVYHYEGDAKIALLDATITKGAKVTEAHLADVPQTVDVTLKESSKPSVAAIPGFDRTEVTYRADAPLASLDVEITENGKGTHAVLTQLPNQVDVAHIVQIPPLVAPPGTELEDFDPKTTVAVAGSAGIGTTDIASKRVGAYPTVPTNNLDGQVKVTPIASRVVLPAVKELHLTLDESTAARLELDPAIDDLVPVRLDLHKGGRTIVGTIDSLPTVALIEVDIGGGRIQYDAEQSIRSIDLTIRSNQFRGQPIAKTAPFNRARFAHIALNELPGDVNVRFGDAVANGGVILDTFEQGPFDAANPLLENLSPLFDGVNPNHPTPPTGSDPNSRAVGRIDIALADSEATANRTENPAAGVVFEDRDDRFLLLARLGRLEGLTFTRAEKDPLPEPLDPVQPDALDPTGIHPQTTTHVVLDVGPVTGTDVAPNPVVIVDVPLRGFDGTPAPLWSRTEVSLVGSLPEKTDVTLTSLDETLYEDGRDGFGNKDGIVDPVKTVTEATFDPAPPTSIHVVGYRHDAVDADGSDPAVEVTRSNFSLIDITKVPKVLKACNARYTGWCTKARGNFAVDRQDFSVDMFGRDGASTGITPTGSLHISRFLACDKGCSETKFVDGKLPAFNRDKQESSQTATFTRMFDIDVPAGGKFELDSKSPLLDNGDQPTARRFVGSIWFDTDDARVKIGAGEAQTINSDECSNLDGAASRMGIGTLDDNNDGGVGDDANTDAFEFIARDRAMLFYVETTRDENDNDKCLPRHVKVVGGGGDMQICYGRISSSQKNALLSSLEQELRTDRDCIRDRD